MSRGRQLAVLVGGFIVVAGAILVFRPVGEPELNAVGPFVGSGETVFLFQSYDCELCWNLTIDGPLEAIAEEASALGYRLAWKNVAATYSHAPLMSYCVWQEFPDQWQTWNRAAFIEQLEPGLGWASMDRLLFVTESELLLKRAETSALERCLFESSWGDQVAEDSQWWPGTSLPALYVNGTWLPAEPGVLTTMER